MQFRFISIGLAVVCILLAICATCTCKKKSDALDVLDECKTKSLECRSELADCRLAISGATNSSQKAARSAFDFFQSEKVKNEHVDAENKESVKNALMDCDDWGNTPVPSGVRNSLCGMQE